MKKALICSLTLLLAAVLVLGVSPLGALPELDFGVTASADGSDFSYIVSGSNATITGYNGSSAVVEIPATLGGYTVTAIGDNAFANCSFTSITIPASVTSIGDYAFRGCTSLASITIPASVTSIGENAFFNCTSLKSVTFAKDSKLESIGGYAFDGCTALTGITVDGANAKYSSDDGVLFNKEKTVLVRYPAGREAQSYQIPAGVTTIGNSALDSCKKLVAITIPAGVTTIEDYAFYGCTSLESINIPSSVTSIGEVTFSNCTSLASIEIPAGVTSIGRSAFIGCTSLEGINIPASVTSIGTSAFDSCSSLKNVSFASGSKLESIGYTAFSDCTSLASIEIPAGVKTINSGAFNGCPLTSVTLNVDSAYELTSLQPWGNHIMPITEIKLASDTLFTNSLSTGNSVDVETTVYGTVEVLNGDNYSYSASETIDGVIYTADATGETVTAYVSGYDTVTPPTDVKIVSNVKIGETDCAVTKIGYEAFYNCTSLKSIEIPAGVTSIGVLAFAGDVSLTEITIPAGVTSIDREAFRGCTSLKFVHIPASVTTIGSGILSLTSAYICSETEECFAKDYAQTNDIEFKVCIGHCQTCSMPYEWVSNGDGTHTKTCTTCEVSVGEPVSCAADESKDEITDPTCSEQGFTTHTCAVCEGEYKDTPTQAKGHTLGEWIVDIPARTDAAGTRHTQCTVCGETVTQPIPVIIAAVDITAAEGTVKYNESFAINASLPSIEGYTVRWESSDTSIATVDRSGNVTGTGRGEVTITATLVDANGNAAKDTNGNEIKDEIKITATMTFWQRIVAFFRRLFGLASIAAKIF